MKNNKIAKSKQIWQFFRLTLISGGVFLFTCIIILILIGWRYQHTIKEVFAENLSKHFDTELQLGEMQLSLLRGFPLATITLSDVSIRGSGKTPKQENLIEAENVRLQFNLIDIIKKEYSVIQLVIQNGSIKPHVSKNGDRNFDFNLPRNEKETQQIQFEIKRLLLRNTTIAYTNLQKNQYVEADIRNLQLGGQINNKHSRLKTSGKLFINELQFESMQISGIDIEADLRMENVQGGEWTFYESSILYNENLFEFSGNLKATGNGVSLADVRVQSQKLQITSIIPILPPTAKKKIMQFQPYGDLSFTASINGLFGNGKIPHISSNFNISNASCILPDYGISLKKIDLEASFTNGTERAPASSQLKINNFRAQTTGDKSRLSGNININNSHNQELSFHIKAETNAGELLKLAKAQNISQTGGMIKLDISFTGKRDPNTGFSNNELLRAQLAGRMEFTDLGFLINNNKNLHYHGLNGILHFNNNRLTAEHISGKAGESNFILSGTAGNLLPYLFLPNELLYVEAEMQSSIIMLDELLQQGDSTNEEDAYGLKLPKRLQMKVNADIEQLTFRRFHAENITGTARLKKQQIHADRLSFNTMDGQVMMTCVIDARAQTHIHVNSEANLKNVNINQLFYQTANFGQTTIVDENIHGSVTANMLFSAAWSEHLKIDWESMETNAQLRIENGRLLNFEPMIALGRFIRTDELDDVSFSTIENHIQIKNRNIIIPMMKVSSNVLNIQMQGEHTFDNEIDYRLRVLLSDLLSRQHKERRKPGEEYGEIIDDGLGRTTLFFRLSGTSHAPVLSYDQEGVREKLRDDMRQERQNLRSILREEFSFMSRQREDSLDTKENTRETERQLIRKQEEEGFIIEWD